MSVEAKAVFEYLGITGEVKDLEDFKSKFDADFVKQSNITEENEAVKKIIGKTYNKIEADIKKLQKDFEIDVDFDSEEYKGLKKVSDKFVFVASKLDGKYKSTISELTEKAGKGNDEKVRELEEKYTKAIGKAKDYESLLKATTGEYEQFKQSAEAEKKNVKLDFFKSEAMSKVKFKADINEFEKEGYVSKIEKSYKFDLDETGKAIILDKEGKRIPNPKVNGAFMEIVDVLQDEAVKGKLFQLNPDAGKPKPYSSGTPAKPQGDQPVVRRKVAARL